MELSKSEQKQVISILLLLAIFGGIFFISGYNYAEYKASKNPIALNVEIYKMNSQYLGKLDNIPDQGHENYLIMNCSHVFKTGASDFQLYFENEYELREDIQNKSLIQVIWATQNNMTYIRGVECVLPPIEYDSTMKVDY